jgi:hypothetical protein
MLEGCVPQQVPWGWAGWGSMHYICTPAGQGGGGCSHPPATTPMPLVGRTSMLAASHGHLGTCDGKVPDRAAEGVASSPSWQPDQRSAVCVCGICCLMLVGCRPSLTRPVVVPSARAPCSAVGPPAGGVCVCTQRCSTSLQHMDGLGLPTQHVCAAAPWLHCSITAVATGCSSKGVGLWSDLGTQVECAVCAAGAAGKVRAVERELLAYAAVT